MLTLLFPISERVKYFQELRIFKFIILVPSNNETFAK